MERKKIETNIAYHTRTYENVRIRPPNQTYANIRNYGFHPSSSTQSYTTILYQSMGGWWCLQSRPYIVSPSSHLIPEYVCMYIDREREREITSYTPTLPQFSLLHKFYFRCLEANVCDVQPCTDDEGYKSCRIMGAGNTNALWRYVRCTLTLPEH